MSNEIHEFLKEVLDKLQTMDYVKPESLPNIDLYMDQVTTFMDTQLSSTKRHEEDKILTKTMINNYAKNNLLPPPDKKKYSKDHILTLLFIYYFKSILSISDIQSILNPITDKYFGAESDLALQDIYNEVFGLEHEEMQHILKELARKYKTSLKTFEDAPEKDAELLHKFAFICMLSFDVYMKKLIIEQTIDELPSPKGKAKGKKKEQMKIYSFSFAFKRSKTISYPSFP